MNISFCGVIFKQVGNYNFYFKGKAPFSSEYGQTTAA